MALQTSERLSKITCVSVSIASAKSAFDQRFLSQRMDERARQKASWAVVEEKSSKRGWEMREGVPRVSEWCG